MLAALALKTDKGFVLYVVRDEKKEQRRQSRKAEQKDVIVILANATTITFTDARRGWEINQMKPCSGEGRLTNRPTTSTYHRVLVLSGKP